MDESKFESWALVEIMGHQRYAGKVIEQTFGGASMLRVDVPEVGGKQAFTKIFGVSSVYAITPVTQEAALAMAAQLGQAPLAEWDIREAAHRMAKRDQLTLDDEPDFDDDMPV